MPENSLPINPNETLPLPNPREESTLPDSTEEAPHPDSTERTPLIEYQDALLELLSSGLPQEAVLESLMTDPRFSGYEDYIEKFDPDMVAVACELMGKWAKQKPTNPYT